MKKVFGQQYFGLLVFHRRRSAERRTPRLPELSILGVMIGMMLLFLHETERYRHLPGRRHRSSSPLW
jgi:hypothetical protein